MHPKIFSASLILSLLLATSVLFFSGSSKNYAQVDQCGEPPQVQDKDVEKIISGSAAVGMRFLGTGDFNVHIRESARDIFTKYPNAEKARVQSYFMYQTCILIMRDKTLSTGEKFTALREAYRDVVNEVEIGSTRYEKPQGHPVGSLVGIERGGTAFFADGKTSITITRMSKNKASGSMRYGSESNTTWWSTSAAYSRDFSSRRLFNSGCVIQYFGNRVENGVGQAMMMLSC